MTEDNYVETKHFPYDCPSCGENENITMESEDYTELENTQWYKCEACGQEWANIYLFSYAEYYLKEKQNGI